MAVLRLNRPAAFNALDTGLFEDLVRALEVCAVDEVVKVIIIMGEGKAFCVWGDVAMFYSYLIRADKTKDAKEGITAFMEKRKPVSKGNKIGNDHIARSNQRHMLKPPACLGVVLFYNRCLPGN